MKAILLAAGKGLRLKEVTKSIPKPMVRIMGKPIIEHNIKWLKKFGIGDIYINLHHLPHIIRDYFGDGSRLGVKITYSYEDRLLGTAGAVKKIAKEHWGRDTSSFVIIYGDNLLDYDLKSLIEFHVRKKGIGTVAVYEKIDVRQSGIVSLDCENRVIYFIEKPEPHEITSHLVNTGIYVFENRALNHIPPEIYCDFGKDVFPKILKSGEKIFAMVMNGALTAVDTPELLDNAMKSLR